MFSICRVADVAPLQSCSSRSTMWSADLIKENGDVSSVAKYLAQINGKWAAVPSIYGAQMKGPSIAHRPPEAACRHRCAGDVSGGRGAEVRRLDIRRLPQGGRSLSQGGRAASASAWARRPTPSIPSAPSSPRSAAFSSTRRRRSPSRPMASRQALDYCKRLYAFLPPDAPSWDDASNNKAFVAGKSA